MISNKDLDKLIAYVDNGLDTRERNAMTERIAAEPQLKEALDKISYARSLCEDSAELEPPELPWRKIEAQIHWQLAHDNEAQRTRRFRGGGLGWLRLSLALAAAFVLGGVASAAIWHSQAQKPAPAAPALAQKAEPGQPVKARRVVQRKNVVAPANQAPVAPAPVNPVNDGVDTENNSGVNGRAVAVQAPKQQGVIQKPRIKRMNSREQHFALKRNGVAAKKSPSKDNRAPAKAKVGPQADTYMSVVAAQDTNISVQLGSMEVDLNKHKRAASKFGATQKPNKGAAPNSPAVKTPKRSGQPSSAGPPEWSSLGHIIANTGTIEISRDAPAVVRFDNRFLGKTNVSIRGEVGKHVIELWRDGKLIKRRGVSLRPAKSLATGSAQRIYRVFRRQLPRLRGCYEGQLKTDPALKGSMVLNIRVDAAGAAQVTVSRSTLKSQRVGRCIAQVVKSWRFAPSNGPSAVEYPLIFHPQGF